MTKMFLLINKTHVGFGLRLKLSQNIYQMFLLVKKTHVGLLLGLKLCLEMFPLVDKTHVGFSQAQNYA